MSFIELMSANVVSDNKRKTAATAEEAYKNLLDDLRLCINEERGAKKWVKKLTSGMYSCTPNINKHTIFKTANESKRVRFEIEGDAKKALLYLAEDIEARDAETLKLIDAAWKASIDEIRGRYLLREFGKDVAANRP